MNHITTQWLCEADLRLLENGLITKSMKYLRAHAHSLNSTIKGRSKAELVFKIKEYIRKIRTMSDMGKSHQELQRTANLFYYHTPLF